MEALCSITDEVGDGWPSPASMSSVACGVARWQVLCSVTDEVGMWAGCVGVCRTCGCSCVLDVRRMGECRTWGESSPNDGVVLWHVSIMHEMHKHVPKRTAQHPTAFPPRLSAAPGASPSPTGSAPPDPRPTAQPSQTRRSSNSSNTAEGAGAGAAGGAGAAAAMAVTAAAEALAAACAVRCWAFCGRRGSNATATSRSSLWGTTRRRSRWWASCLADSW